jgi:hypothetical protein
MNYLKTHSKKLGVVILLLLMTTTYACSDLTSDYNQNPNATDNAPTPYLLTSAQKSLADQYWDDFALGYFGNLYSQYWSQNQYSGESRYDYRPGVVNQIWEEYYLSLNTIQQIIRQNRNNPSGQAQYGDPANQIAVGKILKAFAYQNMTEIWGAIPFGEDALQGAENTTPAYTSQEEVYTGIIKMLTEASDSIDTSVETMASGDIIYGGDMTKWKKLANSLKMRVGIRLADVNPEMAENAVAEAHNAGIITSNDDNALFEYKAQPNNNPIHDAYIGRDDFAVSNTLVDFMKGNDDPRISAYAAKTYTAEDGSPVEDANGNEIERPSSVDDYIGFPYGEAQGQATTRKGTYEWSRPSLRVREATAPAIFMTAAEMLFDQAEAAQRGWISETASAKYEAAIDASMDYWDIDSGISTYKSNVSYNPGNFKEQIAHQKWVALYMQGIQGWSVLRRTDIDFLNPPVDGKLGVSFDADVALRYPYPTDEDQLNQENKDAAVDDQFDGTDDQGQKLWFQRESGQ